MTNQEKYKNRTERELAYEKWWDTKGRLNPNLSYIKGAWAWLEMEVTEKDSPSYLLCGNQEDYKHLIMNDSRFGEYVVYRYPEYGLMPDEQIRKVKSIINDAQEAEASYIVVTTSVFVIKAFEEEYRSMGKSDKLKTVDRDGKGIEFTEIYEKFYQTLNKLKEKEINE